MTDSELNAAVAERVMGWKTNEIYGHYYDDSKSDFFERMKGNPDFLLDWNGAGLVVERMESLGWDTMQKERTNLHHVVFRKSEQEAYAYADTFPRAVALAALKAVGGGE